MVKVLLCGHRSMASRGLIDLLSSKDGVEIDCFSRGEIKKEGNIVTGDVFNMSDNPFLLKTYDVVVNFIIIKGEFSIEKNLEYLKSLVEFCSLRGVKKLVHISTISVYPNTASYVNELSHIECDTIRKGMYASMKLECDKYLEQCRNIGFKIIFVRPGYVVTTGEAVRWGGIMLALPMSRGILLGDKKTSLPLIECSIMIEAITLIIMNDYPIDSFLLLENDKGTKYGYIKKYTTRKIIVLPKCIVMGIAIFLKSIHVISVNKYYQICGLFKSTYFDSSNTERFLNLKLK